jgi:hypothetical protein
MPSLQGCRRRRADEGRGRQIAFAVPQRNHCRIAHAEGRDLGDPRGRQIADHLAHAHHGPLASLTEL